MSNTIRWAFLILTEYPEVQERCYEEILQQTSEEGRENIDSLKCHYTQSVLLECRRLHPVGNRYQQQRCWLHVVIVINDNDSIWANQYSYFNDT